MLEVPLRVVTVTWGEPAVEAGAAAVIEPSELTMNQLAATVPNETPVAPVKLLPRIVTTLPPAAEPVVGVSAETAGAGAAVTVNWSALEVDEVPAVVVTVIWIVPAVSGGAVAVICVSESTVNDVATVVPNLTAVAPVKPLPVMPTIAPPAEVPVLMPMPVIAGVDAAVKVNWLEVLVAELPVAVVTTILTAPAARDGATATICVLEYTV